MLKFLHFADNSKVPKKDDDAFQLYKIQKVINHFKAAFQKFYVPGKKISIDESMIGYRGAMPHLRQYMPNKHHARFGIKYWCVCEAESGYLINFEVYRGVRKSSHPVSEEGATYDLVMRLMEESDLLYKGYHLGLDNFFSSPTLFSNLWNKGTTATGTVRKNRKGLPKDAINNKLRNKEVSEHRKGPLLCVAYQDGKKKPILLSTNVKAGFTTVDRSQKKKKDKKLPTIVHDYNHVMGGVDLKDTKLYAYLSERKTLKWTMKAAFTLFGCAVLNSYIIYSKNTSRKRPLTRSQFMISIIEDLAEDYRPPRVIRKRRSASQIAASRSTPSPIASPLHTVLCRDDNHEMRRLPVGKKKDCAAGHQKRVRTCYMCPECNVGLCPECYAKYHKRLRF